MSNPSDRTAPQRRSGETKPLPIALVFGLALAVGLVVGKNLEYLRGHLRFIPGIRSVHRLLIRKPRNRLKREFRLITHAVRSKSWLRNGKLGQQHKQPISSWRTSLPYLTSSQDLLAWLDRRGIQTFAGRHTIYLPPQPSLQVVLGDFVNHYPEDAGWKILRDFRGPKNANYVRANHNLIEHFFTGGCRERAQAANYLHLMGIGPRLYDVVELVSGTGKLTGFVVQHISGPTPSQAQCEKILSKIEAAIESQELSMLVPNWRTKKDYRCPDCAGNLRIGANGQPVYVDFQHFVIRNGNSVVNDILDEARPDLHFGKTSFLRGQHYLYQSVPGNAMAAKRDSTVRWQTINRSLTEANANLSGKVVLDIGCNAGVMLSLALAAGAHWGLGWDRPEIVKHAERLLLSTNFTRFTLSAAELRRDYPLLSDVPSHLSGLLDSSVIFYLAVREHFGFLSALGELPWQYMVYEGHQGEDLSTLDHHLSDLAEITRFTIAAQAEFEDGDSRRRSIAVIRRRN